MTNFSGARLHRALFNNADCSKAIFRSAKIPYADFSRAELPLADFSGADLTQSVLHRINERGTIWKGTNLKLVDRTDPDLAAAEDWLPPAPQKI